MAPRQAGLAMVPTSLTGFAVSLALLPRVLRVLGPRRTLVIGLVVLAAGHLWLAYAPRGSGYLVAVLPGLLLVATASRSASCPPPWSSPAAMPGTHTGLASGLAGSATQVGAALGTATFTAIGMSVSGSGAAVLDPVRVHRGVHRRSGGLVDHRGPGMHGCAQAAVNSWACATRRADEAPTSCRATPRQHGATGFGSKRCWTTLRIRAGRDGEAGRGTSCGAETGEFDEGLKDRPDFQARTEVPQRPQSPIEWTARTATSTAAARTVAAARERLDRPGTRSSCRGRAMTWPPSTSRSTRRHQRRPGIDHPRTGRYSTYVSIPPNPVCLQTRWVATRVSVTRG